VNINGCSRAQTFFCSSENIIVTGLLLETDQNLHEGDRLICSLFLPESQQITVPAVVEEIIHNGMYGLKYYGVRFGKMNTETRNTIGSFV
jgi:hypothetical protein